MTAYQDLWIALAETGSHDDAIEAGLRFRSQAPEDPLGVGGLAWVYALAGRPDDATDLINELEGRRRSGYFSPGFLACVYVAAGDAEKAMSLLDQAYGEHDSVMTNINLWFFDPLRSDPRFQALLRKMNFPQAAPAE